MFTFIAYTIVAANIFILIQTAKNVPKIWSYCRALMWSWVHTAPYKVIFHEPCWNCERFTNDDSWYKCSFGKHWSRCAVKRSLYQRSAPRNAGFCLVTKRFEVFWLFLLLRIGVVILKCIGLFTQNDVMFFVVFLPTISLLNAYLQVSLLTLALT